MIVVADASPLITLVKIGQLEILPALFGEVFVPPEIVAELSDPRRPQAVRAMIAAKPPWVRIQAPLRISPLPGLHSGERAAISLAVELKADLLLIDERDGRTAARSCHLEVTGTVGTLVRAAKLGLLDLADAFARLKETNFWIPAEVLDAVLVSLNGN